MRIAGRLAASVLEMIEDHITPGVSTEELNKICHDYIVDDIDCIPAPLNYGGGPNQIPFPKSICTSVNQVVCHGIPSESKILKAGDTLNIDITVIKDGFFGDTSKMFFVGEPSILAKRLIKITQECLYRGIDEVKDGATLGDIGEAIQKHAENNRFSVVREFCGHGIGRIFHDAPQVLHYGKSRDGHEDRGRYDLHDRADDQCRQKKYQNPERQLDRCNERPQTLCTVGTHFNGN